MNKETFIKARDIIGGILGIETEEIKSDSILTEDLYADSLDLVEIGLALEDEFGIEIPDEEAENMRTVKDVVSYIDKIKNTNS